MLLFLAGAVSSCQIDLLEEFSRHPKYHMKSRKNTRSEKVYSFLNIITKRKKSVKKPL